MTSKRRPFDRQRTVVLLALAAGASRQAAASEAGVADRTLRRWVADDETFAEAVEVALGKGRGVYERLLREAADKDWRAALAAYELVYLGGPRRHNGGPIEEALPAPKLIAHRPRSDDEISREVAHAVQVYDRLLSAYGGDRGRVQALLERNERLKDTHP